MSDSDDDEMARLRASKRYDPKIKAKPAPLPAHSMVKPAAKDESAAKPDATNGELPMNADDMAGFNLPMSFGKIAPKVVKKSHQEAHAGFARGSGPQPMVATSAVALGDAPGEETADIEPETRTANMIAAEEMAEQDMAEQGSGGLQLPISHEIHLKGHQRAITSMSLDPKGARLITGGADNMIYMWDFAGMTSSLRSFRSFEPQEGYPVSCVRWNNTGANFAVSTGEPRMKIYSRDGHQQAMFTKGDMYIYDPNKTKGHTHPVTGFQWHPHEKQVLASCSKDCSIRVFDVEREKTWMSASGGTGIGDRLVGSGRGIIHRDIAVLKDRRGRKTQVSAMAYSADGGQIAATGIDGSLQIYRTSGNFKRPDLVCWDAHESGTETSCVRFSLDTKMLITRGGDDTLKVWDARKLTKPIKVFDELISYYDTTECCFSPEQNLILTGTSAKKDGTGRLVFIDYTTLEIQRVVDVAPGASVVSTLWNSSLNQIVAGGSDGARVLYSPEMSTKGAMLCAGRKARVVNTLEVALGTTIYNPHALPLYQRQGGKRKRESIRHTLETKKPPMPTTEMNSSSMYHSFMMKGLVSKDNRTQDPREVYLQKSDKQNTKGSIDNPWYKKGDKDYVSHVYEKNQPINILEEEPQEQADGRQGDRESY